MVQLMAIDLDGTLLNNGKMISEKNIEAIKLAHKSGIEVVIATGRADFDARALFNNIGIDPWIIGTNGATIHKPNGELFHSVPLDKKKAIDMLRSLEKDQFYYEAFIDHKICAPQYGRELLFTEMDLVRNKNDHTDMDLFRLEVEIQFAQSGFTFISSYNELLEANIDIYNILAISFDEKKLQKEWEKFADIPDLTVVQSGTHNFHLQNKEASKGNALKILANQLQVDLAETAAIGDNYNDLSMLQIAGRSAAMRDADQEIKDACQFVTSGCHEDGVAHFIHLLLQEVVR
ncbi:HAD family phosphatase [Bacillus sp. V3B]|uniref:Cof-type HAD-IIB family hydrolase n=1 Tax=Bacillus sp. V3B TaxID=2804915 RepID=UPI00210E6E03|nr:Cof-type HAD-IIB family hydrolase [Bacillus sp. V3B]MCQ6276588.1 HAD family phosphatase [Bacillus sp. V3B]